MISYEKVDAKIDDLSKRMRIANNLKEENLIHRSKRNDAKIPTIDRKGVYRKTYW